MHLPLGLFAAVTAAILGAWWWLGAAVPMPPSPLAAGEKLYCISYAPFRGAQNPLAPGTHIEARQIEEDLIRLARVTDCIRTYSIDHGLDQIAEIAARHGLKVMQGIWLSGIADKSRREVEVAIALANRFPDTIRAVVVGNEVLLRGEMTGPALADTIRRVKAQVKVPVTYADVWEFWLRNRDVYEAVDFVTIHILPYWEDFPIAAAQAGAHVDSIRRHVVEAFPAKEILIGETGWPSAGRMREGALPSPANQARVIHDVLAAGKRGHYRINVIEAFDQPWKRWLEGTVGGHWGLFDDRNRAFKFAWGEPVSNHPLWRAQAAGGIALAAIVFAGAWFARRLETGTRAWLAVAVAALGAGVLIGWTVEKAWLESLGLGGWMRSGVLVACAVLAPIVGAAAAVRGLRRPSFAQVLGGEDRPSDALAWAVGLVFVLVCAIALQVALGLTFDPRYRDFPFPALAGAVLPYLLLAPARPARRGENRTAELVFAGALALAAVYIALNEGLANWQALGLAAALVALVTALLRGAAARGSGSAA